MAGLAVTHGAQGLWYYSWDAENVAGIVMVKQLPELQEAIRGISSDMAFVASLLDGRTNDIFRVHGPAHVRILTKDDRCAVLVAHSGYEARTVTVSSAAFKGAQLIGSNPDVRLDAGTLTVKFPSCGFEVVRLKLAAESSVPINAALSINPDAAPEFTLNDIASIAASSNAPGDQGGAYREIKMGDGSLNDNWASARNYPLPVKIRVTFEQPKSMSRVVIYPMIMTGHPGYDAWGDTKIMTSDGQSVEKTFTADDHGPYTFDFKPGKLEWFEVDINTTLSKTDYIGCREIEIH